MSTVAPRDSSPGLPSPAAAEQKPPPALKPCCACPETKRARDACIIEKGEEHCDMNKMKHTSECLEGDLLLKY
ncbi:Cytochrome C oxidase copper chaperone [Podarcis lilfordi]|uniref:Cytochrome C oxidase copper chaperone n=1 Tax=Podarcis lilfordi TaxID=74358 RepID=A0AA35LIU5_9SAUR|nr:Cytochrome C oxidase copper chaperone [Podarcis lilfordi]